MSASSDLRDPKVPADLAGELVNDLRVTWDRGATTCGRDAPPGVPGALAELEATVAREVPDERGPLHDAIGSSL